MSADKTDLDELDPKPGPYGFVYFAQAEGRDGPIKIGFTTNLPARLASLNTASSRRIVYRHYIQAHQNTERRVHALLDRYRVNGEWFANSDEVERFILCAVVASHDIASRMFAMATDMEEGYANYIGANSDGARHAP